MKSKSKYLKIILFLIVLIPPFLNNSSNLENNVEILNYESIGFYQTNTCNYGFYEFLKINLGEEYLIQLDKSSLFNCYFRINSADEVNENIIVYLGTNLNLDLIIQSIFWLLLISLIPKQNYKVINKKYLASLITTLLAFIHLISESGFYEFSSKLYTVELKDNYLLFSLLITIFITINIFGNLVEFRKTNLIYFLPYTFVFAMSFNSLNINLILLFIIFLGFNFLFENKIYLKFLIIPFFFIFLWTNIIDPTIYFFDIDKLKGFSSSSYNNLSVIYWSLSWIFLIIGILDIIKSAINKFDINKLRLHFLLAGSLTVVFSIIAASNNLMNFLSYYFLGLNKFPSNSYTSVAGNAWRGISSSAEAIGEFFAYIILFSFLIRLFNNQKFRKIELAMFPIITYGLYKSNNFSAALLLIILLTVALIIKYSNKSKLITMLLVFTTFLLPFFLIYIDSSNPLEESSKKLIREGLEISYIENLEKNEFGQNAIDQDRYLELLLSDDNLNQVSTSLIYLVEKYHYSKRNNIPNLTTLISSIASPINRSEKWGIFFGKYNPNAQKFLFGTGVNQLGNYYLSHNTKLNYGLVLPHSSLLSYLVFVGVIGLAIIFFIIFKFLYSNKENHTYIYLNLFLLVNFIKSDSLLYLSSLILFIFTLNSFRLNFYEK